MDTGHSQEGSFRDAGQIQPQIRDRLDRQWRVSPGLLSAVKDIDPDSAADTQAPDFKKRLR
jgi:hypothetical protein